MTDSKDKKGIYHSELRGLEQVTVEVKSDVLKSKYGKRPYVLLGINGKERSYTTENDSCSAFFEGMKGRSLVIVADGSKEDATLTYIREGGSAPAKTAQKPAAAAPAPVQAPPSAPPPAKTPPTEQSAPAANPVQPPAPPANGSMLQVGKPESKLKPPEETRESQIARAEKYANRNANLLLISYRAARYVRAQVHKEHGEQLSESQFHFAWSNITIEMEKGFGVSSIPSGLLKPDGEGGAE